MVKKLYSIYDSKSESYDQPWLAQNKGIALRSVLEVLKDSNHPFAKWPADFTLFEVGEWDDQTGTLTVHPTKINIGVMHEFLGLVGKDSSRDITNSVPLKSLEAEGENRVSQ